MTVKLDIPALAPCPFCDGTDIRFDQHSSRQSPTGRIWSMCCYHCGATFPNRYKRELLVEKWNTRSTTALEIGRAMEHADIVAYMDTKAAELKDAGAFLFHRIYRDEAERLRSTPPAVDLEGLATASLVAELESVLADINNGAEPEPSDVRDLLHGYKRLLSSLGLHAREN